MRIVQRIRRARWWVPLVRAHVRGDVVTGGVMNGVLGGAIRQSDTQTLVVGAMLAPLTDAVARDCPGGTCASGSTGASVLALFDANHDGMITADELRSSSLVMSVLSPDLDLFDAAGMPGTDGVNDSLSVGVGFTAVNATFASP